MNLWIKPEIAKYCVGFKRLLLFSLQLEIPQFEINHTYHENLDPISGLSWMTVKPNVYLGS